MREYVYFSQRLATKVLDDNQGRGMAPKATLSVRPGGVGGDLTWDARDRTPTARHALAEAVDAIVRDHAAWGWDPNEAATYLRGRGTAFLSALVSGPKSTNGAAMIGSTYQLGGDEVNLCLFGSRHNLDGAVPDVDPTRKVGWFSSSTMGVRQLLSLVPKGPEWDEELAFADAAGVDDEDLVWSAANIMRGQGLVGDGNRPHAEAPSLRGHTILEGQFEWLARIYWWSSGDPKFHNVAVGAPVYVRTIGDRPWTTYEPLAPGEDLGMQPLQDGRMTPDIPLQGQLESSNARGRPWWWPF